jgi:acetate---CoA ligase (ADP-forming)
MHDPARQPTASRSPLDRLLAPRSIALFGGAWVDYVAAGNRKVGFSGELWRVHPKRTAPPGETYYRSVEELPGAPDAAFVAVPNTEVPAVASALARKGAGGFVCFASGFSETGTAQGLALTSALDAGASGLPYFGPNCYGFVNFFDRAALWPDQVVGAPIERGVALICQSGTLALTLMFNRRSLPLGYVITVGNQTRVAVEDLLERLAEDPRVSAFGLYLEGVKNAARFAGAVERARAAGKPIALVKAGRTEAAARTAKSHTGSLAGADVVFDAYCRDAGVARCDTLGTLCETLKILHAGGPLPGRRIIVMGASGGDMAMVADTARDLPLSFPPIPESMQPALQELLSDRVTIANPFDLHTYLWFDPPAMTRLFATTLRSGYDYAAYMLDCPPAEHSDLSAYLPVMDGFIAAAQGAPTRGAMLASLPETFPEPVREACLAQGVVPMQGLRESLEAIDHAARIGEAWQGPGPELRVPTRPPGEARALTEHAAKRALAVHGVTVPRAQLVPAAQAGAAAEAIGYPVVLKASGETLEHKSELGGVVVGLKSRAEVEGAALRLAGLSPLLLVEEMVVDGVAEILVGLTLDPQFGQVLVLGAGGVMTELLKDVTSLLPPFTPAAVARALDRLKVAALLKGFRGKPAGDVPALVRTILAVTEYARSELDRLVELDVNPVIVRPRGAVAVDALIRLSEAR